MVLVSLSCLFVGNVPIKVSIVSLGQALGDAIQALRYRGVSTDNIPFAFPPVPSLGQALDAAAELGRNPVREHQIKPEYGE